MLTEEGRISYLTISGDEVIRQTQNGFQVVMVAQEAKPGQPARPERIAAEYIFIESSAPVAASDVVEGI